ncbi:MAG: glycoside hydrolase family 32 protein [Clostridiales bacterium]|nr:glycoside hydrolase family 32 protein [Clostridiales bacterium]
MTSQTLRDARHYEETSAKKIKSEERPAFHLSPYVGWMNDPNGFSWYKGQYHLFYQYHPYKTHWDSMHWGHAVSKNLLHWEYLPTALAPDQEYDSFGCFSGSAIELPDGKQLLMYTAVDQEKKYDGSTQDIQTQAIAIGDGIDYVKYEKNPVLSAKDLPEGCSKADFRDPKIWKGKDGLYYCVIGNRPADGSGQILLYSSENGFDWKFVSILAKNENRYGKMWECPDFFELDGKHVLLTSPQDMLPEGLEYHNGNGTLCIIGELDEDTHTLKEQYHQAIDYGIDFYAPQTVLAPDGRRIMIGWMQNWDTCNHRSENSKWFAQMSLPRELSVKNGRLYQKPVKELDDMRENKVEYQNVALEDDTISLEKLEGRKIDMELVIRPQDEKNRYKKFAVRFAQNEQFYTALSFRPHESILKIDRKFSGSRRAYIHQRRCLVNGNSDELKLRIILDKFSVEVFINDGEQVMSATIFTDQDATGVSFFADGKVNMDVVKYDLI